MCVKDQKYWLNNNLIPDGAYRMAYKNLPFNWCDMMTNWNGMTLIQEVIFLSQTTTKQNHNFWTLFCHNKVQIKPFKFCFSFCVQLKDNVVGLDLLVFLKDIKILLCKPVHAMKIWLKWMGLIV